MVSGHRGGWQGVMLGEPAQGVEPTQFEGRHLGQPERGEEGGFVLLLYLGKGHPCPTG